VRLGNFSLKKLYFCCCPSSLKAIHSNKRVGGRIVAMSLQRLDFFICASFFLDPIPRIRNLLHQSCTRLERFSE
jgi:hypothetical protein